ncbi:MAG TPA: YicC/YloC family endoribonuclease [Xanthobacteraceae bacterium]|nr:YicC/YloC family endoribonuclease [Xanthobacteraceae bacterium]
MALSSMTGFARGQGVAGAYGWAWEIRSVNAKGLDLRLRLPPGWDAIEAAVRGRAGEVLARGTLHATLNVERKGAAPTVKVNEEVLAAVIATLNSLADRIEAEPARLDGILAIKGVIEVADAAESDDERTAAQAAAVNGFEATLAELAKMRRHEGEALGRILLARLGEMSALVARAEASPGRKPDAIRARLAEQVATLLEAAERFDPDRLHQEAILIASKADVREELDRLTAHIDQATKTIRGGGAVGRRLDFLAQELNRETNTLCAKANDMELTNIGLELKSLVEQFREQVQNLE